MTARPDERAAAMTETSEKITEHHTGADPAPTGPLAAQSAGGSPSGMIEKQPNGLHRCRSPLR